MKRYPHTATIVWIPTVGTVNSLGVYTQGAASATTLSIYCNIQPMSAEYLAKLGGDKISQAFRVFCPLLSRSVPSGAKLQFMSKEGIIRDLFNYQRHTEMEVIL